MSKRLRTTSSPTQPVTIRLLKSHIARLENEAAAAMMSRSAYIEARLIGNEQPHAYPHLSALAHLISIHATIERAGTINDDQLNEIKLLVLQLARSAYCEGRTEA